MSRPSEPVETTCTSSWIASESMRMMEPLPNCFSICASAAASAFVLLSSMKISFGFGGGKCINERLASGVDLYFYTAFDFLQHPNKNNGLKRHKRKCYSA